MKRATATITRKTLAVMTESGMKSEKKREKTSKATGKAVALLGIAFTLLLAAPAFAADPVCEYNEDGSPNTEAMMAAQGTQEGDAGFVAALDLDGDGVISLVDANRYLQLCLPQ